MLIKLPNADFSAAGLGTVTRLVSGMPVADLVGLWLFEDGDLDDEITAVADASGNGNTATLKAGWSAGIKRSYGVETPNNDGMVYETLLPINPAGRKMTVFVAGMNTLPGSGAGDFNNWVGLSNSTDMATPGAQHPNDHAIVLNYDGTAAVGHWQLFDNGSTIMGQATVGTDGPDDYNEAGVAGIEIDGATGTAKVYQLGHATATRTDAGISSHYDGATDRGTMSFGPWAHAATRSASASIAQTYAVAAYLRTFTDAEAQAHMTYLRDRVALRGVTFG